MESTSHCFAFVLLLLTVILAIGLADISSDVKYLRKQYKTGKNQSNNFIIEYNGKQVHNGDVLQQADTQTPPTVQINVTTDPHMPYFTLLMADPDAPKRGNEIAGPWLHWIKASFTGNNVNSGTTLATYQGPTPPVGTGPHRYIILLFKSASSEIRLDDGVIAENDATKRKQFQLRKFEKNNNLKLVAATSFIVRAK